MVPLAGEGTSSDIVDPSLDLKDTEGTCQGSIWMKQEREQKELGRDSVPKEKDRSFESECFIRLQSVINAHK